MTPWTPITEADLHAFVDGQLPTERQSEVQTHLCMHEEDARLVAIYRDQKRALHALFDPVLDEAIPPRMRPASPARSHQRQQIAAAFAIALISGAMGWSLKGLMADRSAEQATAVGRSSPKSLTSSDAFVQRAAMAHAVFTPEVKRPVEVDAAHEEQLVTWLSKRMGKPIKPPHLQALGYALEGGRLLPGGQGPVAQFMYRNDDGQRLTLYVSNEAGTAESSNKGTAFRFAREGQLNIFYWVDHGFGYAISAQADRPTLAKVSTEVYAQLTSASP